ncbi:MAG TPA: phosphatase PAP2 family protein [Candidatus Sabulitectum sp.]|nr:phosphatase PAP2 family protein [Candidatus Sabulitectum sp.]HPF32222.1 phosphatase PAP2 family protein [Candidatus Sabulitectum sp.]HPJ27490.1 phosphatase PAP2 family protein [Candidatus Sabulitectum sp.]HPR21285.1 phosphatase PAP2 family protein [Candidatus Sabulitectum sp.]
MRSLLRWRSSTGVNALTVILLASAAGAGNLVENTLETGENLLDTPQLVLLGAGGISSLVTAQLENDEGSTGFLQGEPFRTADKVDDFLFGPFLPASAAGVWLGGMALDSPWTEEFGEELCRGLFWTYGVTAGMKYAAGRTRPDGTDPLSFPSAHAAGASCTAAVLWNRYGPSAGVPAAAIALYTCLSRVNTGRHFPSDAVMGAALGTACGLAASLSEDNGDREYRIGFMISIDTSGRMMASPW